MQLFDEITCSSFAYVAYICQLICAKSHSAERFSAFDLDSESQALKILSWTSLCKSISISALP